MQTFVLNTFLLAAWTIQFGTTIETNVVCPSTFSGGVWDNCKNRENETCTYSCLSGYHKNSTVQNATCGRDGAWNRNTDKLCRRICETGIKNGYLNSSCTLETGESCSFVCKGGFKVTSGVSRVTCQENGEWRPDEPCEEVLCPATIPNGRINETECDRRVFSECSFICNEGFDPNPKQNKVVCEIFGTWSERNKPACLERKGLCINVFEHGKWAENCRFTANELCAFECDGGFDKNPNITVKITCTSSAEWNIDPNLLCKEYDGGLIITLIAEVGSEQLYTVPTTTEGSPRLDSIQSLPLPVNTEFLSVDGDYGLKQAYFYDYRTRAIYKDSTFSIGLSGENHMTALHIGLSSDYVRLAVDWISHNIYWTDPQYKWIMVQSLLGNGTYMYRVLIHDNLDGPHALALDPIEALLFWSDIGSFTKIEVSSLSGRNRKSLIASSLIYPHSLAADYVDRRLYFLDSIRQTVETVTYEGSDRKRLLKKQYSFFFDIAVYKDYLYVTDEIDHTLHFFNKTNGEELHKGFSKRDETYYAITAFYPGAQSTSDTDNCGSYGCAHICVTEKDGATCLCKDGYALNQDMKTCSLNNEYFHRGLMYSNESSICIVDIRIITDFVFKPNCVLKTNGTKFMILDTDQRRIIIANDTSIYWVGVDNLKFNRLTEPSGTISGLAWDGYDRNLYWTETNTGTIWRLSGESQTAKVFLDGLHKPRDILILPHERLIYWISDRNGSTLESAEMDGSDHQIVLEADIVRDIKSLSYDPYEKRIYYLDFSAKDQTHVISCQLNGSNQQYFLVYYNSLEKIEIYRGHMLVTAKDANGTLIMSYSIKDKSLTTSGVFIRTGNISAIKVYDETFRQNETGPCFNLNGECEHICISNGTSRICECTFGFKLAVNGKTCTSDPIQDNFMLVADSTDNKIYQISLTDQSVQGIKVQEAYSMTGVTYNPVNDILIWGTYQNQLSIMHLNGTGKKLLPVSLLDVTFLYPNRFAVDYSTGNIYYTTISSMYYFEESETNCICVLSPDGKHRILFTGLHYPTGLVVYPSKGLMYYTDASDDSHLGQTNMDGSQSTVLLNFVDELPTELTIDYQTDYLYWLNHWGESIGYCKLDGTNHNILAQYPRMSPRGLALYQDSLFISTSGHSHMIKLKISNPNETTAFAAHAELGTIGFISIFTSTNLNKNAFCSVGNGGCSTFCFPTPGGGKCGCEDGVGFKEGSDKICSNVNCNLVIGSSCSFFCDDNFRKNPNISSITCNDNGQWNADLKLLCTKNITICPNNFPGGSWDNCQYMENETCTYSCSSGFQKNPKIQNGTCGPDGAWNRNTENLCRRKCDPGILNGYLNSSCILEIGETCTFECESGYKAASGAKNVTCEENGLWAPTNPCEVVLCPTTIPNGTVNETACNRRIYSECSFICNKGFDPNPEYNKVFCDMDGKWDDTDKTYCLARKGLCTAHFEHGKWKNDCHFNADETCAFECDGGYEKNTQITTNITCTSAGDWNVDLRLLCKDNDHGLIVTLTPGYNTEHVNTVPTAQDGTPNLDYIRSLSFHIDVEFLSVAGDYILQQAYVYDHYTKAIYKDDNFSIGLSGENKWMILHIGLSKDYVKLAVDWISHNIYWTDPQFKWIMVQSLLGNDTSMYRVLIHDNLDGPHALALDPNESLLFWSDIGTFTKIEVSSLSGRNRKSLISSNLLYPYSVAADCASRHLYIADAGRDTVETVTYEGKDRKILLKKSYSYFFDIAVYKDYLYVIDSHYYGLCFFNKTSGKELQKSFTKPGATYFGINVFHPDAQPTPITASCVNYGCEQICVTEKDGATCLCKDGYNLNQDRKLCSLNSEFFHRGLVFSNESSICIVDIRIITDFVFDPNCVLKTNGTKFLILDTDQREIILANDSAIYWARVDNPQLHSLTDPSGIISGLAWDGYDRNVYWSESNTGTIWRVSRQLANAQVFLEGLSTPRDVLILPHQRLIFWVSDMNGRAIESSQLDGSNHQIVLDSNYIVDPRSLTYDPYEKRIYFLDTSHNGRSYVISCYLNGSDLRYFLSNNKRFDRLEIYKGHLLVTAKDDNGSLIMSYSIDLTTRTASGKFSATGNISAIKVFDENLRQNETGPCFNLNGECEQICISNGESRICECAFGFKLAGNGKSCISDPIKDNFMLVGDSTHNDIYQISLTDQSVQGINTWGTYSLRGITYSPIHDLVIWATYESKLSIMHLNGTGKKLFPVSISPGSYLLLSRFAVDHSTGNIYYTVVDHTYYLSRTQSHIGVSTPKGKHRILVTGLDYPQGLVVYPSKGLLFYTDGLHLGQANMDGSQSAVLLNFNDGWATELTVDYKSDYLYWINYHADSIEYCKLDGSNHNTLTRYSGIDLEGLAFYQDYLFISTRDHSHMIKLKISNPNETTEFAVYGELGTISSISVYSSTVQNKNEFCSVGNGGCSTFCFPIPGGGICGCEDGVDIREGSSTICSNIPSCPDIQNLFLVSHDCPRVNGSRCTFTCNQGYKPMSGVDNVLCNGGKYTPEYPCEEIKCPATLENGKWVNCNFLIATSCNYTCNYGYTKNDAVMKAECQVNGKWNLASTDILCKHVTCPKQFSQGIIVNTCPGMLGQRCDYECTGYGYKKNENITQIECMGSGMWSTDTDSLCQQITCPNEIPNGVLLNGTNGQICSTAVGMQCDFECNSGFLKLNTVQSLHCLLEGWAEDLQILCTVPRCPDKLNQVIVSSDCQRVNGSKCTFTCNQGYTRRSDVDTVLCNGETYTPDYPCEAITCPRQFNQGIIASTCAGMIGQRCDYECTGYSYRKNESILFIECMESGTWNRDTSSLCQLQPAVATTHQSEVYPAAIGVGVAISVSIVFVIIVLIMRRKRHNSKFALERMKEELISGPDLQMSTSFGPDLEIEYVQDAHNDYPDYIAGPII